MGSREDRQVDAKDAIYLKKSLRLLYDFESLRELFLLFFSLKKSADLFLKHLLLDLLHRAGGKVA